MAESDDADRGINTRLAHLGHDPYDYFGFINPPVVHASTVLYPDAATMVSRRQRYTYGTVATPTTEALASAVTALEGAAGTILAPSGLAAVTVPLLGFLAAGDHLLVVDTVYGPTRRFADTMLRRLGIEVEYYHPGIGAEIAGRFKPNTRVVFAESPGSLTFEIQDVPALAAAAHASGIVLMLDNTWATPLCFRALDHGVDVVISAATKYQAGHSDVLFGTASANAAHWERLRDAYLLVGACPGPDDAYQVLRGLRTLGVRLARHQSTALALARWLEGRPEVARVLHPALDSHPDHALWKRDFIGATGVFSFVLAGQPAGAHAFLNALTLFGLGYSWGGFESLAVPANLADRTILKAPRDGTVIRLQVGLEDVDDLKADLARGLKAASAAAAGG